MSLSKQGSPVTESRLSTSRTGTSLNPNAAEFVPFSLRGSTATTTATTTDVATQKFLSTGKQVLDRSESSISTNSDEESRQYWQRQLPDDITPDFNVMGEDESQAQGLASLSLAGLSLHDASDATSFSAVGSAYMLDDQLDLASAHHTNGSVFADKSRYPVPLYRDDPSPASYLQRTSSKSSWDMQIPSTDHHFDNGATFDGTAKHGYPNDMAGENAMMENNDMNPVEFLTLQFPGFAAESLAEVYCASGYDLNLTIEMLTQLELQVDGAFNQTVNSKALSAPNLTSMDFPALPVPDNKTNLPKYSGAELQQTASPFVPPEKDNMLLFKSRSSLTTKGATDFASAVRKLASQDSSLWKYDRNGSADATVGPSRSAHAMSGSYNTSAGRSAYVDRLQGRNSARAAPVWLETGDAVANLYSELRGEARDHARVRNAYFEQARQAYLIGNKALAKELSVKGQLHNMQMKAAHNKAQESIYRQRNPISPELQGGGRSHEKMIDLHGLHVSEAIHVLRHELSVLRHAARSAEQRLHVYICVGTGHHTRGSRTPARLPIAVQRYLLEEEGLEYTEPQPGLLRVVLN